GVSVALDISKQTVAEVQKKLGMKEGFDVGLEMSGSPAAFRDMLTNMCHGGKIALLGIPEKEMITDDQIDRLDPLGLERGQVLRIVPHRQNAAVHSWVERFDPAVQDLGEAGHLGNVGHGEPRILQRFAGSSRRNQLDAEFTQDTRQIDQSGLIADTK